MSQKIYYAHFMSIYDTKQEERDIKILKTLFPDADIINPNSTETQEECKRIQSETGSGESVMDYFKSIVDSCHILAFRGCVNGKIGAGVYKEIRQAQELGLPIIELPSFIDREMSVESTRQMLKELGTR